jgi:hypothetical protein
LKGVKAILKVTPEMRWRPGKGGGWETSVVPILGLEIGGTTLEDLVTTMTAPARLLEKAHAAPASRQRGPYVARESEEELASEIAGEFYPQNKRFVERHTAIGVESQEHTEHCAAVCELARRLGYSEARIRKLLKHKLGNPLALGSKVGNERDEEPDRSP